MIETLGIPKPRPWLGVLLLIVCTAMWSLNGPLIKLLGREGVPGITIACYRSLLGGLVFLPLAWPRRGSLGRVAPAWIIASVATFTLMTATFVIATTKTSAASAIILQNTSPIWVFLLSPLLLREYPARADALVLLIAMAGVFVIFSGNPHTDMAGMIIAIVSGVGYGALIVVLRALRPVNPTVVACLNALGSGLLLLAPVIWQGALGMTPRAWALMVLMGLVQFTLPYALFSAALQHIEAHRASLILLLETILNPIWTYLAVGEVPPPATLLGGPLILAGVAGWLILTWRRELTKNPTG
jgi:drug/metabolite transporter (DMT)-like permease